MTILTHPGTDTVYLVLYVELVLHLVDGGEAAPELVADLLQAPGHLGGVHSGVHGDVREPDQSSLPGFITYKKNIHLILSHHRYHLWLSYFKQY